MYNHKVLIEVLGNTTEMCPTQINYLDNYTILVLLEVGVLYEPILQISHGHGVDNTNEMFQGESISCIKNVGHGSLSGVVAPEPSTASCGNRSVFMKAP